MIFLKLLSYVLLLDMPYVIHVSIEKENTLYYDK